MYQLKSTFWVKYLHFTVTVYMTTCTQHILLIMIVVLCLKYKTHTRSLSVAPLLDHLYKYNFKKMSDYFGDRPITGHGGPQPDSENPFEQARPFTRGSSSLPSARPLTSSGRPMTSGVGGSRPGTSRQQAAAVPEWLFEERRRSVVVAWWQKFRSNRIYCTCIELKDKICLHIVWSNLNYENEWQ